MLKHLQTLYKGKFKMNTNNLTLPIIIAAIVILAVVAIIIISKFCTKISKHAKLIIILATVAVLVIAAVVIISNLFNYVDVSCFTTGRYFVRKLL